MIGAFICGGLGNQMFQYAAGRALALRHKTSLRLDLASFVGRRQFEVPRPYELNNFAIEVAPVNPLTPLAFRLARRSYEPLRRISGWRTAREPSLGYFDPNFETLPDNTYIYGYWQSWRYFDTVEDRIRAELQPRITLSDNSQRLREQIRGVRSLGLHVRRGDYISSRDANEFHGVLGSDFYKLAVRHVQERTDDLQAFVFSDDLDWCRSELACLQLPLTFVDVNRGKDSWQDLYLMAACDHNIIANSSFSWWGAWLGDRADRPDRVVIAPGRWFAGGDLSLADRCPPKWTIM